VTVARRCHEVVALIDDTSVLAMVEPELFEPIAQVIEDLEATRLHAFEQRDGKEINPATVDWAKADIKTFDVFQPPGPGNALGDVKFMFPNHYDVYMHDTPSKELFADNVRAFSHGCMRVQDPQSSQSSL
jgi:hypothetical protein